MNKNSLIPFILFLVASGTAIWLYTDENFRSEKFPLIKNFILETLNIDEDGSILKTKVNGDLIISLESNPTTGYQWEADYDPRFVELIDKKYQSQFEGPTMGAGGKETFYFLPLQPGRIKITFTYMRQWEKQGIKEAVYNIKIE